LKFAGTRRNTGQIHDFKKGAFRVAIQSKLPILPVVYSSYTTFLDDKNKKLTNGNIIISVLPEISTENMTLDNLEELMDYTKKVMIDKYNEVTKEVQLMTKTPTPFTLLSNNNIKDIR
jgi:lysophosphatidate acyltransferase